MPISDGPMSVIFNDHVPFADPDKDEKDCVGAKAPVNGAVPLFIDEDPAMNFVLIKFVPLEPTLFAKIIEDPDGEINSIFKSPS